jgi:tol-pal system protein YbgF
MKRYLFLVSSLFFGIAFANAPVTTLSTGSDAIVPVKATASTQTTTLNNNNVDANLLPNQAPVPQVVNSQEVLSSLTPEQRLTRIENQITYLNTTTAQINGLNAQVEMLRGEIEDLNHQIKLLQKQVTTLTQNQAVQTKATPSSVANPPLATTNINAPTTAEQQAYQNAYDLMAKKQYTAAIKAFNAFLTKYPKSTLAATTHYWLGDLYLVQGQPDNASQQYRTVISNAEAAKRPDAMVKLGTILLAYGDNAHAKALFKSVIKQYPNTPAATQAAQHLKDA